MTMQELLPTVSVVVLNYNGLKHLEKCFTSLLALDYPQDRLELLLADNGSSDASLDYMREHFPTVRLVETGGNLGFAGGNNYGAEHATGEYVAFLNNDTRVEPDWLSEMVHSVLRDSDRGVVCTSSLMLDWSGEKIDFQAGALNFHGFGFQPSYGQPVAGRDIQPRELLFACGGSMLIQRDVFLEVGGFDPDFFAFFEDVDLGWRLWVLGYSVTLTPTAITYHRHHGSFSAIPSHRTYLLYERNALYAIYKNYEQETLDKALPAALLLLGQRAVRFMEMGGADLPDYDLAVGGDSPGPTESVHRNVAAGLLAVSEFMDNLDRTSKKREWIQSRRKRSDAELFRLFGSPGHVNLWNHPTDAPYAVAHHTLLHEFGLADLWSEVPKEVLVISPDVLPVGDIPASGSGIRAWALGKGLEGRGHHVHYTMPAPALKGRESDVPEEYLKGAWTTQNLQSIIDGISPDLLVCCGWPNMTWVERANLPVALDLTGPHLLERAYQGHKSVAENSAEKLRALAMGDFFTCIGERQKYYFDAWLTQAGVEVDTLSDALSVIPYSVDPKQPEHIWPDDWNQTEVQFVYGGIFLPWQNPAPALLAVASTIAAMNKGQLEIIGGKHPFYPIETGGYGALIDKLAQMDRVKMSGLMPHGELIERYRRSHVAVDLFMPNVERELAFPSRTVNYLWCGLPVIHAAFSEVSDHIRSYEAGWIVPHDDEIALRDVIISILANPSEIKRRGQNAQRLARERFSWDQTVHSLDAFVRQPYMRPIRGRRNAPRIGGTRGSELTGAVAVSGASQNGDRLLDVISGAKPLTPRLQRLQTKRRTLVSQLAARTTALAREIGPVRGTKARPNYVGGRQRFRLPELLEGHSHGERFLCPHNGLSGVGVVIDTFGKPATTRLRLHLRDHPGAAQALYSVEIPAQHLKSGAPINFRFPPIPDSAGRWLYLVAESPDGVPGDAVTLWATERAENIQGQRYEDGLPASGHLLLSLEFNGVRS
jgi:GT2 family glycosyltransferase/glycosyltransferase involved in cell wall biosynthesis